MGLDHRRNTTLDHLKKKKDLHLEDIYSGSGDEADNTMASDKVADETVGVEESHDETSGSGYCKSAWKV